ncbi:ABC transporter permease, partial [Paenibacillus sp. 3LSP]|nr:ABC transporter permease [Paenibacillus sp. 3LSP]
MQPNKTAASRSFKEQLRLDEWQERARKLWAELRPGGEGNPPRERSSSSFWVMVQKEIGDHLSSWRFGILMGIIVLACIGSIYSAVSAIRSGGSSASGGAGDTFLFLKMYTLTSSALAVPSFSTFLS